MDSDKYKQIVDSCKTKDELLSLRKNTLEKGRDDLAIIVDKALNDRFPNKNTWRPSSGKTDENIPLEKAKEIYKFHPSLISDEIEFLARHSIPPSTLFNARGMSKPDYQQQMRREECDIAYGTTPCSKAGHRLRTRSGHCIQCRPANISYQLRHKEPGEVYVAESVSGGGVIKIGCSIDSNKRITNLNSELYAGRRDWVRRFYYGVKNMGLVEFKVHAELSNYAITNKYYISGGQKTLCTEIFSCSTEMAIKVLKEMLNKHPLS